MSITTKQFNGRNVFIALRPSIFGHENEHVTLEYIGHNPDWNVLTDTCTKWIDQFAGLPVTVAVNGYANWSAKDDYHNVALVEFREYPELSFSKNWHITLETSSQPIRPMQFDRDQDAFRYDYPDRLWVGYKDSTGERKWIDAHNAKHVTKMVESIAS